MGSFQQFIDSLYEFLTGKSQKKNSNIIRKHSKKLEVLGDLSFPLKLKNWCVLLQKDKAIITIDQTILTENSSSGDCDLLTLTTASLQWVYHIQQCKVLQEDVHLYLNRPDTIRKCICEVIACGLEYGTSQKIFTRKIELTKDHCEHTELNLSELRVEITHKAIANLLQHLSSEGPSNEEDKILITSKSNLKAPNVIVCGSIVDEKGLKDDSVTSSVLYKKRTVDMQLMAQHKYGVQAKASPRWCNYFAELGKASVTLEMLQNKPHKNIKMSLNDLQTANKGPSFIFYNCARLSALFKEFNSRIANKTYPHLPPVEDTDLTLLNQPEEWELLYVYVLRFPMMIESTVNSIEDGIVNPHFLISFLSGLSSVFSVYYRRIKILTSPREHMFPVLFARIYLLKCIELLFHKSLLLLDIEPIKEM